MRLLLTTCVALVSGSCLAQSLGGGAHPVQARIVVEATQIQPDSEFELAVVLDMAPAWHTYWAFSGDAGLPSRVDWRLPDGFQADELRWPGPHRYTEAGDLTVFGYADQVALFTHVQTPDALPDTLHIGAEVSWLVCADICIPGDTTLTWAHVPGTSIPDRGILARYRPLLSTPLTAADPVNWSHTIRDIGDGVRRVEVSLTAQGDGQGLPDFYPRSVGESAYIEAGPRQIQGRGRVRVHQEIVPYAGEAPARVLTGVIGYEGGDGIPRYRSVSIDLTTTQAASFDLLGTSYAQDTARTGSLWIYLLMAMVGGLILNLMPCVLPVISLKVMSLVGQAGESAARVRQLGLAFVAGIVVTFLALAATVVALQAGGEQIGWGFQFQSPGFVLFLTGLVFLLGLSLFGVVTIRLPGACFGGVGQGEGPGASFANGVLATILATPCTAPFLGAALGFAFSQSAGIIFAIFAAAGIGMALPYLVLAWHPGWIRYLPKPGAWMEHFKQSMGFLLMATVLWLLWVLGKQLGMEAVVWTGAFLLCLALGAWFLGSWVDLRSSARQRAVAWVAALAIALGGYVVFLRPLLVQPVSAGSTTPITDSEWEDFDVDRVEAHIGAGRTVFLDFTAEWCWTCKVNERTVLADADVRDRLKKMDVVLVRADWTSRNTEITQMLRAFGRSGVPLYVIFPGGRPEQPLVLPEVITTGIVLEYLDQAEMIRKKPADYSSRIRFTSRRPISRTRSSAVRWWARGEDIPFSQRTMVLVLTLRISPSSA